MITLRKIKEQDLADYKYWQQANHKYQDFNGPYFKKRTREEIDHEIEVLKGILKAGDKNPLPRKRFITNEKDHLLGEVSWYWKSEETHWLEIGIILYDNVKWGKGIGYTSLYKWINEVFDTKSQIVRIGLTTWSGNIGMVKLAEKLGLKKEAEYRKARIINGLYYDSVSYGILREEWEQVKLK